MPQPLLECEFAGFTTIFEKALIITKIYPDVFRKIKREYRKNERKANKELIQENIDILIALCEYALTDDDCSEADKRVYEEVRKLLNNLKPKEIATDSPMGSGILDLTNRGNKIAERLPQDVQETLTKHELKEVILPTE
ncbi:4692_t:CDS:2, partial [Paraglomus brasilianum]